MVVETDFSVKLKSQTEQKTIFFSYINSLDTCKYLCTCLRSCMEVVVNVTWAFLNYDMYDLNEKYTKTLSMCNFIVLGNVSLLYG